jgi:hypothetical protein
MRAISPISRYGIQLIEAIPKRGMDRTGTVVEYTDAKPVHAQFTQGGLTEWEQIAALEHFDFSGLPEGVNPLTRVSVFDTEAAVAHIANAKERIALQELMDERLRHFSTLYPSEFMIVEKPPVPKPWPSYDTDSIEKVLQIQEATEYSPEAIRLYEMERPHPRVTLIQRMAELEQHAGEEQITVAI